MARPRRRRGDGAAVTGASIGHYRILGKIGEGGMGEVYRARDTKLDRDVAIKILPAGFAADPERLARFEREARTLAALNHPNIAHIHGAEEASSAGPGQEATRAIVMELVEGDDLSQRIARGPLALAPALAIARQIADAMQAAHDLGIVHRDLKPANVKVRADGTVKVLDFGLAKAQDRQPADPSPSQSPTLMTSMPGTLLGTAAYMSPEQVKGQAADARSDVWAFGCLLFEMLTGRPVFAAATTTEILASVLTAEPDWQQPPDTPEAPRIGRRRRGPRSARAATGPPRAASRNRPPAAPRAGCGAAPCESGWLTVGIFRRANVAACPADLVVYDPERRERPKSAAWTYAASVSATACSRILVK
jgi:serine/threonine protein kinase